MNKTSVIRQTAMSGISGKTAALPHMSTLQSAFGAHHISNINAYMDPPAQMAAQGIGAAAYAMGNNIAFDNPTPDLYTVAHEVAHVIQQRQGIHIAGGMGQSNDQYEIHADAAANRVIAGQSAAPLFEHLAFSAAAASPSAALPVSTAPIQKLDSKFKGRSIGGAGGNPVNTTYGALGYILQIVGGRANTNCAINPFIRTAGERKNNGASDAGTPTNFAFYRDNWSQAGGLVKDKNLNQASTKMHAINHRFDNNTGAGNTQDNPQNIFLGTQRSNNPNHLHKVENPILRSLQNNANNAVYEQALTNATATKDKTTNQYALFWPGTGAGAGILPPANFFPINAALVAPGAVRHVNLNEAVLHQNSAAQGITVTAAALPVPQQDPNDVYGYALLVDNNTAVNNFEHPWIRYQVTPNYGVYPAFVGTNINVETTAALTNFAQALIIPAPPVPGGAVAAATAAFAVPQCAATGNLLANTANTQNTELIKALVADPNASALMNGAAALGGALAGAITGAVNPAAAVANPVNALTHGGTKMAHINTFQQNWAPNAFPANFTCHVAYYTASYNRANPYLQEQEQDNYSTDL